MASCLSSCTIPRNFYRAIPVMRLASVGTEQSRDRVGRRVGDTRTIIINYLRSDDDYLRKLYNVRTDGIEHLLEFIDDGDQALHSHRRLRRRPTVPVLALLVLCHRRRRRSQLQLQGHITFKCSFRSCALRPARTDGP